MDGWVSLALTLHVKLALTAFTSRLRTINYTAAAISKRG